MRTSPLSHSCVDHTVLPANNTTPAFTRSSPGGATTEWTVIAPADEAYYSFIDLREDERLSWPCWLRPTFYHWATQLTHGPSCTKNDMESGDRAFSVAISCAHCSDCLETPAFWRFVHNFFLQCRTEEKTYETSNRMLEFQASLNSEHRIWQQSHRFPCHFWYN